MWDQILSPAGIIGTLGTIATGLSVMLIGDRKVLRESINDLRGRVEDLEKERDDLKGKVSGQVTELEEKTKDLAVLTKTVTGEAHWVTIEQLVRDVIDRIKVLREEVAQIKRKP